MREVIFRGISEETGKWCYGSLVKFGENQCNIYDGEHDHFVIPETVGQFTGLHDVDGKRIFEGDVLMVGEWIDDDIDDDDVEIPGYFVSQSRHVVEYKIDDQYPAFDLHPYLDAEYNGLQCATGIDDGTNCRVTGTIHDEPKEEK